MVDQENNVTRHEAGDLMVINEGVDVSKGGSVFISAGRSAGNDAPEPAQIEFRTDGDILINGRVAANDQEIVEWFRQFVRSSTMTILPNGKPGKFTIPANGGCPALLVESPAPLRSGEIPPQGESDSTQLTSYDGELPLDWDGEEVPSRIVLSDSQLQALCFWRRQR